jgi:sn-glycerol 3-phosphate transport system permease protein
MRTPQGARRTRFRRALKEALTGYLMIFPAIAVFAIFVFYPLVKAVWLGFFRTPPFPNLPSKFVGFSQYASVITSSPFVHGLWLTILFVIMTVPTGVLLGIALALLAHEQIAGIRIFRTLFSSTVATSTAVASVIFFTLLNPQVGLFSYWLGIRGGTGVLGNPTWALPAVAVVSVWQNIGFTFILMSAALLSIPEEFIEAARIDGASSWLRVKSIVMPLLSPTIFFAAVVGIIASFQAFGQVDLLTRGGPDNHTRVLIYYLYQAAFVNDNPGVAAVVSVVLFAILAVLTYVQFRFVQRRVFYGG